MSETEPAARSRLSLYLEASKSLLASLLYCVPLFVAYQVGVLSAGGVRNGLDFVTTTLLKLTGGDLGIYLAFNVAVLVVVVVAMFFLRNSRKRGEFHPRYFPWMLLESSIYACLFGAVVNAVMNALGMGALLAVNDTLTKLSVVDRLVLAIGAGLYEEIVFRLIFLGGLYLVGTRIFGINKWVTFAVCAVVSSAIFSLVHHLGSLGDDFEMSIFAFRFVAGMILALIFWVRGLAVAVYTHAIYDIIVMVLRA